MMKLQSPCLWRVTFLLLWRATSGMPMRVNSERRSSISGAVYSTNSKPSVPIGFSRPRIPLFSASCVDMSHSFAVQLLSQYLHFMDGDALKSLKSRDAAPFGETLRDRAGPSGRIADDASCRTERS